MLGALAAGAAYHQSRVARGVRPRLFVTILVGIAGLVAARLLATIAAFIAYVQVCPAY